jgi:excisionase family DNA binding protein
MSEKLTWDKIPESLEKIQSDISDLRRIITANNPEKPTNRLFVLPEAAEFLHLSKATLYRFVADRSIPFHKQGGKLWFLETELLTWIQGGNKTA